MKFNKETLAGEFSWFFAFCSGYLCWQRQRFSARHWATCWSFSLRSICPQQLSAFWQAC